MHGYGGNSVSIIEITDLEIPELEVYIDKKEVQLLHYYEPEPGIFIAESPNVILRALEAGYEPLSLLMEKKPLGEKERAILDRCGEIPGLYGFFGGSYENHRISACAGNAVCDAAQSPSFLKRNLCRKAPDCDSGGCGESNECRSHFPVGSSTFHGCGAVDEGQQ